MRLATQAAVVLIAGLALILLGYHLARHVGAALGAIGAVGLMRLHLWWRFDR